MDATTQMPTVDPIQFPNQARFNQNPYFSGVGKGGFNPAFQQGHSLMPVPMSPQHDPATIQKPAQPEHDSSWDRIRSPMYPLNSQQNPAMSQQPAQPAQGSYWDRPNTPVFSPMAFQQPTFQPFSSQTFMPQMGLMGGNMGFRPPVYGYGMGYGMGGGKGGFQPRPQPMPMYGGKGGRF